MAELKKLYPIFLKAHPKCSIKSPVCTVLATCIHHTQGRGKNEVLNQQTWQPSCQPCNHYVEENHEWAVAHGNKVRRIY